MLGKPFHENDISALAPTSTKSPTPGCSQTFQIENSKFDGKIINWQTFWDQFESSTDSQENITDTDKISHLRSLLCDIARETI